MPYLHLSLQAGSDIILKRMKRRHLTADAAAVVARARALRPDIGIGADIIAGFPTEDDALFEQTLEFVRDNALPYLHVFPYSERPGTPAARMPAIAVPERKARAARLRAAGAQAARDFHERLRGRTLRVLMETDTAGHSEEFAPVRLVDGTVSGAGRIEMVRPVAVDDNGLVAEIL